MHRETLISSTVSRRRFLQLAGSGAAIGLTRGLVVPPYAHAAGDVPAAPDALTVLAYNESPFGIFPAAREAILAAAEHANRYPKETGNLLRDEIAHSLGVDPDMVVPGSGSIEPLKIVTELFCTPKRGPVVAEPTFEAVMGYAGLENVPPIRVPLTSDHRLDLDHMVAASKGAGLLYVCNPNNPTGTIVDKDGLRAVLERLPGDLPVLIDEAYHDFVDDSRYESCVRHVAEGRNVIVLRTFSKVYGLAGLRIGYAVAAKATAQRLAPHRLLNTLNIVGIAAARASLADQERVRAIRTRTARIRASFAAWVQQRKLPCIPSDANFVMIDLGRPVPPVIEALRQRGFLVGRQFPSMPNHLRVSLGTEEQMQRFQPALAAVLGI